MQTSNTSHLLLIRNDPKRSVIRTITPVTIELLSMTFFAGDIISKDRIPRKELLQEAREAATKHNTKLLICFGGNGRSNGFSVMVRNDKNRQTFLKNLATLLDEYGFDGVGEYDNSTRTILK